jgi:hypothetical protein
VGDVGFFVVGVAVEDCVVDFIGDEFESHFAYDY